MCGAGIEQYYVDLIQEEEEDKIIDSTLVDNSSFASITFSTFFLRVPAPQ